ncbi:MAG TPA: UDP-3-O-(3-hydroxymyristoyl)glucosamine N-acyltransferase [Gemmataceae bacterium]|nr:UDP-3-O-(3-hydroxymyristoyl)glucosamine N-acyltransferase [Gemmataceae bacterium]
MSVTARQLAALVQGELIGDGDTPVVAARSLCEARAGDVTFIEHAKHFADCHASVAVVPAGVTANGIVLIGVADPLAAFVLIVKHLQGWTEAPVHGIDPRASVHPTAQIGPDASVHAFAVVGEGTVIGARCRLHSGAIVGDRCRLGDDVVLHANAVLYDGTILGNRVIIHGNAVLGADGFGYRAQQGRHVKVPQLGHVEVGDDVEIGACTTIDRGTFQATRIGEGTKIDNLVQIGHNCRIGAHNLIVSQAGIAGSSSTGDHVIIAGQVGIVDHVHIGAQSVIGAQAGVTNDVPTGQHMLGSPATPLREQRRILMSLEKLPEIRRDLRRVMQHLGLAEEAEERKAG